MLDYYGQSNYPSPYYGRNVYQDPHQSYTHSQYAGSTPTIVGYQNPQGYYQAQNFEIQHAIRESKETERQYDKLQNMLQDFTSQMDKLKRQQDIQAQLDEHCHQAYTHEQDE